MNARDWDDVDWRFVLPTPTLRRVWLTPSCAGEGERLRALGIETPAEPDGAVDVALATGRGFDPAALESALAPGTVVRIAIRDGGGASSRWPWREWRARLEARGWSDVRCVWAAPSLAWSVGFADVEHAAGVRLLLSHAYPAARFPAAAKIGLAGAATHLPRAGLHEAACRDGFVIARTPAAGRVSSSADAFSGRSFTPSGTVLLTPHVETSRYLIALMLDGAGRVAQVAKVVRRPQHQGRLVNEWDMLQRVAGRGLAPTPLELTERDGHWTLVETGVAGTPLNRHRLSRKPQQAWRMVEDWLMRLPPSESVLDGEWWRAQFADPLARVVRALPATDGERRMFAATESALGPLASSGIPAVTEHGDLFRANLFVRGERLTAIDWELGRPAGLPGADAAVFLADLLRAGETGQARERSASYRRHFLAPDGEGRRLLGAYLTRVGVDPGLLDVVLLATWARRTLQIWGPLIEESAGSAADSFRAFWARNFWRLTLERIEASR